MVMTLRFFHIKTVKSLSLFPFLSTSQKYSYFYTLSFISSPLQNCPFRIYLHYQRQENGKFTPSKRKIGGGPRFRQQRPREHLTGKIVPHNPEEALGEKVASIYIKFNFNQPGRRSQLRRITLRRRG